MFYDSIIQEVIYELNSAQLEFKTEDIILDRIFTSCQIQIYEVGKSGKESVFGVDLRIKDLKNPLYTQLVKVRLGSRWGVFGNRGVAFIRGVAPGTYHISFAYEPERSILLPSKLGARTVNGLRG